MAAAAITIANGRRLSMHPPRDDGAHIDADGDGFTLAQTRRFDGGR
jgi:hypothetical protein